MKRLIFVLAAVMACAAAATAQNAVTLQEAVGTIDGEILTGTDITFLLRVQYDSTNEAGLYVYRNGFHVYSPDGAEWDTTYGSYLPVWPLFGDAWRIELINTDGVSGDSLVFHGEDSAGGFMTYYNDVAWSVTIEIPQDTNLYGKTICIDRLTNPGTCWPPTYDCLWAWWTLSYYMDAEWDGPHCFTVQNCCRGLTGNVDFDPDDNCNIVDLTRLICWFFGTRCPAPECPQESDINGDGDYNIIDLTSLVDYLFGSHTPPAPCQ